jgi:uncharacterized ParB-like nuclease family protein
MAGFIPDLPKKATGKGWIFGFGGCLRKSVKDTKPSRRAKFIGYCG